MKKINLIPALILTVALVFTACKKDKNIVVSKAKNAKEFAEKLGPQKQTVSMTISTAPQTITLKGGTKITFPVGSLTKNGLPVTGEVTVVAYEMLKRSAVILGGTNTNHISGAPLVSDGFIFIDVKANGESVDKNLAIPVKVRIPAEREGVTQLWEGVQNDQQQMAWQAPKPANGAGQREVQSTQGEFAFDFGMLGWINCDVFWSYSNPKTTMSVEIPNNPGTFATFRGFSGETFVFFCAKGSNVAAQLYTPDGTSKVKSYDNVMPVGEEGRLIAFSIKDGKYYFAKKDITITANQNESLVLVETTEANVQTEINNLDNF
ncbi:hypothetical protein ACFSJU_06625 [Paradesertivirga mongoliensis]|uniref:Uncharacterized protein n=1 Tax=Paradesertivirga mongoliensis TaxID=2100740 RepID=A0ABW4ZKH4_9SPHI|nr:hypothetical protein [Pedobacter mongoliensis]